MVSNMQTSEMLRYFYLQEQCIIVVDEKFDIIFWNKGASRLFGYETEDILNKNLSLVVPITDNEKQNIVSGTVNYYETEVIVPGFPLRCIKLFFNPIFNNQRELESIWIYASDMSQLVERLNLAEEASKAKSKFLADLSHEIRNSLMGVLGFCELLKKEDLSFEQKESVETIHYCSQQLLNLVKGVLDLSKIESQKITLQFHPFNIIQMIKQTALALQPEIQKKHLKFKLVVDPKLPQLIISDETRIQQVLNNLLVNSIKYTDQGLIELRVVKNKINDMSPTFFLTFSVHDTGLGIKKEDQKNIFLPFIQLKRSETGNYTGVGLGLAISKHLVKAMGGRIWCEDNYEGQGSVFSFTIPVKEARYERINESKELYEYQKQELDTLGTILLAEDMEINRKLIKQMLKNIGYDSVIAENGQKCLEMLQTVRPDAILLDMQMPVMDGYEAARQIRKFPQWDGIPIIALTAYAMQDDIQKCTEAGCDYYLSKPFTQYQLEKMLQNCLDQVRNV